MDTGLLRDHLHAATAIGRMAAAAKAVELGYGIEADPGPSGRLGGWSIAGIPKEAWEVHATRAAQIDEAVGPDASYRSRAIAARATRDRKSHERVEDLVPRPWRDELARAGYPPLELAAAVERAGLEYRPPERDVVDDVATELLVPRWPPGGRKDLHPRDVIVAVAPHLHGLPVSAPGQRRGQGAFPRARGAVARRGRRPGAGMVGGLCARGRAAHRRAGRRADPKGGAAG